MKRLMIFVLVVLLAMTGCITTAAAEEYLGDMIVVNCEEWVSLRDYPSTSAARKVKVPLGETVDDCVRAGNGFIYCNYRGISGYILSKYLSRTPNEAGRTMGDMVVMNCDEWVSLRNAPSKTAARLLKVPLGEVVYDCVEASNGFIACSYKETRGYILEEYLEGFADDMGYYLGEMTIVNCDEWVSLREGPSSSSDRLTKIPLGATVYECYLWSDEFAYCEYAGMGGYVKTQYLAPAGSAGPVVPSSGDIAMHYSDGQVNITAYRSNIGDGEQMTVLCTKPSGELIWDYSVTTSFCTELSMTEAFIAGTMFRPAVVLFSVEVGLIALDMYTGEVLWVVSPQTVDLGGGICWDVDSSGTIYVGGYYGPDPVAIDCNGRVLWQSKPGVEAYWMYEIAVTGEGVIATYDCLIEHEKQGRICYDAVTGSELYREWF